MSIFDGLVGDGTIKYVRVNATADGDNTVITAVTGKKIRVLGYVLVVNAAGAITLQDDTGTPVVYASFDLAANGGISYAGGVDCPAFETAAGHGVEVSNGAGVDTKGHITYVEA